MSRADVLVNAGWAQAHLDDPGVVNANRGRGLIVSWPAGDLRS
jgi:hypothetical protein